jgi:NAD(P)-dependent dehydrogenase (short-subunit alcohol dehydrogenase family)
MIEVNRTSAGPVGQRLAGKIVLVTGAGSGQGQSVALLFAMAGARVAISDIGAEGLTRTCALAVAEGLELEPCVVDASDPSAVVNWVDAVAASHGGIDVLYNNGAAAHMAPFADMSLEQWRETLKGELDVVFLPTRAAWRHLIARGGGSIINVASVSGMRGTEFLGAAAHAAGKAGVIGLTRQLALEGAPHWIRANCLSPGPILTPLTRGFHGSNEVFRRTFDGWPLLARSGDPLDVAYAGLFLASDESRFITGVNLPVDGGWSCKGGYTAHEPG